MNIVQWVRLAHTGRAAEYTPHEKALWRGQRMRIIPTVVGQTLLSSALGAGIALGFLSLFGRMSLLGPDMIHRSARSVVALVAMFALLGLSQALTRRKESFIRTRRLERELADDYVKLPQADVIPEHRR